MLLADNDSHSLLQGQAIDAIGLNESHSYLGKKVGAYRIVREVGSGGMGVVFLAERAEGEFEQHVAIKLIKHGLDSREILERFQSERQILARLQHANIARLLDGGVTPDGQPYFAMEYVDGLPIDAYCDRHKLSIPKRLHLFQIICSAVHHAHQNLLIHRDLKPGNILVTEDSEVKLLDFGIAKVLSGETSGKAPQATLTLAGERMMTPEYASPEQVRGETVSTATDVYSLGVILYELLTGQRPYRLKTHSPAEIERTICTTEPEKPSTAIGKVKATGKSREEPDTDPETVSVLRSTQPDRLRKTLAGDLDNICLMALQKEPQRRYASVEQLREDLSRYLTGQPVRARADTFAYRAQKFIHRHKGAFAATLSAALLMVALVTFYTMRLAQERDRARLEAQKAEQVAAFLSGLFAVSDPGQSKGETITARELLETGAQRIEKELADQPEVQASMMGVIDEVYRSLGLYEAAQLQLQRAVQIQERTHGPAAARFALAVLHHEAFDHQAAREALTPALAIWQKHPRASSAAIIEGQHLLAQINYLEGKYETADSIYRAILPGGEPVSAMQAGILRDYGALQREMGHFAEAEMLYRRTLAAARVSHSEMHPEIATDLHNLGDALRKMMIDAGSYFSM
ncbi:MAG: protein kinase, partial [Methyloligellaceae bacterium]